MYRSPARRLTAPRLVASLLEARAFGARRSARFARSADAEPQSPQNEKKKPLDEGILRRQKSDRRKSQM